MNSDARKSGINGLVAHYFMASVGYFGLLSTLVVILNAESYRADQIALLVTVFTFANKVAKIPLAPWLDRLPPARSVLLGCAMASAGIAVLPFGQRIWATAVALLIAGIGMSINSLAVKQLAASASDAGKNRVRMFSLINIAVNVASAVAAPVALFIAGQRQYQLVSWGVALIYLIAGAVTSFNFSASRDKAERKPVTPSSGSYLRIVRLRGMQHLLLINFFGWLLYGQLFNVLALHVSSTLHQASGLGLLYSLNALLVVFLQLPITSLSERLQSDRPLRAVHASYLLFSLAFLAAWCVPGYAGATAFVVIFTIAEMTFIPRMDVLLLDLIGNESRAVSYGVLSISTALGESAGGGLGLIAYRWLGGVGHQRLFWLAGAATALCFVMVSIGIARRVEQRRSAAQPAGEVSEVATL